MQLEKVFQGSNVRIAIEEDKPLFHLGDVLKAVESKSETHKAIQSIDEAYRFTKPVYSETKNRSYDSWFISEYGLIELLLTLRVPKAKPFKKWAIEEVIPTVMKTGKYEVKKPKSQLEQLAEAVLLSQQIIEEKDRQIEQMKPAVAKHDAFLDSDRQLLISSVAKAYKAKGVHIGRSFSEVLKNLGLIYLASQPESKRKKWRANTEAVRQGLLVEVDRSTNGYTRIDIRVTPKGLFDIYDRLCKMQGVKPYPKAELAEELIQED